MLERQLPRKKLIKHHAQGVDVRRRPHEGALPAGLLWGHVARRADQETVLRQRLAAFDRLGEAKINDFGHRCQLSVVGCQARRGWLLFFDNGQRTTGNGQQDIRWFQVPVDDSFAVRHVDGTGQGFDERGGLARRPGLTVEPARQTVALDPLHREEWPAFVAADLIDLYDVGVLHPRRQLRLEPEPELLGWGRELARQHHLQGRQPVQAPVPRLVHHPHAPAPDLGQDVVVSDLPGGGENHRRGFRVFCTCVRPGFARLAQGANRRAALGRGDKHLCPAGSGLLEPRQQPIVASQLIDAVATRRTVPEVLGDVGQLRLGELA